MLTAMNVATLLVSNPLSRAYTGPIEKMMAEISPDTVTATTPSGEFRYSSQRRTLRGNAWLGTCCADTTIGTIAREISTETSMNGVGVRGSDKIRRNWAAPKPTYNMSMYIANSRPRFARLARSFSQLSATT